MEANPESHYEAPAVERRTTVDASLIGDVRSDVLPCAVFRPVDR